MVYINVTVHLRKNNVGDHIVEKTALPDHLIKNVRKDSIPITAYTGQQLNTGDVFIIHI